MGISTLSIILTRFRKERQDNRRGGIIVQRDTSRVAIILENLNSHSTVYRYLLWSAPGSVLWERCLEITFKTSTSIYAMKIVSGEHLFFRSENSLLDFRRTNYNYKEVWDQTQGGGCGFFPPFFPVMLILKGHWSQMPSISLQKGLSQL